MKIKNCFILLCLFILSEQPILALNQFYSTTDDTSALVKIILLGSISLAIYKINNAKRARDRKFKEIEKFNKESLKDFHLNSKMVIAFDLHGVIANYNIKEMFSILLKNLWSFVILLYPKAIYIIFKEIKRGSSTQEILDNVVNAYPNSEIIKKIYDIGILMSSQLKTIDQTINIIKNLLKSGYRVVIMSNIEQPLLWQKFIKDYPFFEDFEKFTASRDNKYLKKPNPEFYIEAMKHFKLKQDQKNDLYNCLLIDDNLKFTSMANRLGIPSYIFTSPENLEKLLTTLISGNFN